MPMNILSETEASAKLGCLIDETASAHEPVLIKGERTNVVLVSEEDWNAIQETLYLLCVPGMREPIHEGIAIPIEDCSKKLDW